jgi:glutathione S-transferase
MSEIVIHIAAGSPYCRAALLGLEEKRARYRIAAMLPGANRSSEHLQKNPFGRVPVLEHGDFRLYEAQAILRYLDVALPGLALQPKEPKALARMSQIANIVDWYVMPSISVGITAERLLSQLFWNRPTDETNIANALPQARICIRELERLKDDTDFMAGDELSIADLMLAPHLAIFTMTPEGEEMLSGSPLTAWLDRVSKRDSWAATETERLLKAA